MKANPSKWSTLSFFMLMYRLLLIFTENVPNLTGLLQRHPFVNAIIDGDSHKVGW